jgi:hypothetical protein
MLDTIAQWCLETACGFRCHGISDSYNRSDWLSVIQLTPGRTFGPLGRRLWSDCTWGQFGAPLVALKLVLLALHVARAVTKYRATDLSSRPFYPEKRVQHWLQRQAAGDALWRSL